MSFGNTGRIGGGILHNVKDRPMPAAAPASQSKPTSEPTSRTEWNAPNKYAPATSTSFGGYGVTPQTAAQRQQANQVSRQQYNRDYAASMQQREQNQKLVEDNWNKMYADGKIGPNRAANYEQITGNKYVAPQAQSGTGGTQATIAPGSTSATSQPRMAASSPSGSVDYQTGIQVGNAVDPSRIRELVNTQQQVDAGSATGDRAVDDYTRSMNMNNQAQMDMAVQGANSQQLMNSQQKRSESSIAGLNDQAAIYSDAADRFRQTLGLNTSVDAAKMSYDYGIQANNIRRLMNIQRGNP